MDLRLIRDIDATLDLLSRTANKTDAQKRYRQSLIRDAQNWIDALTRFAMLKPGKVQNTCLSRIREKQGKLDSLR